MTLKPGTKGVLHLCADCEEPRWREALVIGVQHPWLQALVRSSKEEVAKTGLSCIQLNDTTFCMVEAEFHHLLSAVASDVMSLGTNPKESKEILKLGQEAVAGSDEDLHYATASEPKPASTAFQKPKKAAQASSSSEDSSELGVGALAQLKKSWLGNGTNDEKRVSSKDQKPSSKRHSKRFAMIEKSRDSQIHFDNPCLSKTQISLD